MVNVEKLKKKISFKTVKRVPKPIKVFFVQNDKSISFKDVKRVPKYVKVKFYNKNKKSGR